MSCKMAVCRTCHACSNLAAGMGALCTTEVAPNALISGLEGKGSASMVICGDKVAPQKLASNALTSKQMGGYRLVLRFKKDAL